MHISTYTSSMFHRAYILTLLALLGLSLSSTTAFAAPCGTAKRPSLHASCSCPVRLFKGRIQVAPSSNKAQCKRRLQKKIRTLCKRRSARSKVRLLKLSFSPRSRCAAQYVCKAPSKKLKALRWHTKVLKRTGRYKHKFKYRMPRAFNACKKAGKVIQKRMCKRTPIQKPTRFNWRKVRQRVRYFMGYKKGYCTIQWTCIFKKRQWTYWCAR